jgi:hypothetical protein
VTTPIHETRRSRVRAALAWGRRQAGEGEAAALAARAAARARTPTARPSDLVWARELAARAAALHIAFAALAGIIADLEQRVGEMRRTWREPALRCE